MVQALSRLHYRQQASYRARRNTSSRSAGTHSNDTVWLFDLDNTLHDASREIFEAIDQSMAQAVADTLKISLEEANRLRTMYWRRYGATVIGLVRHHGINMRTFLKTSHQFDIASKVHAETGLAQKLGQLKGRKIVFTNAPLDYACTVLETLKILHHFEDVWAIENMSLQGRLRPKPSVALMRQVVARLGVPAHRIVLVEDTLINLKSARQVGMKTAYIFNPHTPFSSGARGRDLFVNTRVNSIGKLLIAPGRRG